MTHKLKTLSPYFLASKLGEKKFELRRDDRGFSEGDAVLLQEWTGTEYTGQEIYGKIIYILRDFPGLEKGYCILGVK